MRVPVPLLLALCLAAAAWNATAAPLQRADVPANPAWLLHVDCDTLRQTYLGKYLLYQLDKPEVYSNLVAFRSIFSFDLRTQLRGVTVYSSGPVTKDGVVIIYADFDSDRIVALVKGAGASAVATNNQHTIYSWIDKSQKSGDAGGARSYAAFQGSRLIVSKLKEALIAALGIIDGSAPNFSTSKALPEPGAAGDAMFIKAFARKVDFLESNPSTALLKSSKLMKLQASEADEHLTATLNLEAVDEFSAKEMSIVAQGFLALLILQKDHPDAAKLADGISIKQDGVILTATLSIPSTDLIALLKVNAAKSERKKSGSE